MTSEEQIRMWSMEQSVKLASLANRDTQEGVIQTADRIYNWVKQGEPAREPRVRSLGSEVAWHVP